MRTIAHAQRPVETSGLDVIIRDAMESRADPGASRTGLETRAGAAWRAPVAATVAYALLAVAMTWPLARAPSRLLPANPDVYLKAWEVAWVAHALFRDPLGVYDANMFYPQTKSLAYDDGVLPLGLQAVPVFALGGSVALAYNVVLLSSFPLCGLAAYALARDLGSSRSGALLGGLGFAFSAYRWDQIVHLQSLSVQWLPLAVLFLRRTLRTGRIRDGFALWLFAVLQVLTSGYYAFLLALALGLVFLWEGLATQEVRPRWLALGALALAIAAAVPSFSQHRAVVARHGFRRSLAEARHWSAGWASFVEPGPYGLLPHVKELHDRVAARAPLFPGSLFLGLGFLGALHGRATRVETLCLILTAAGVLASLGPEVGVFGVTLPGPFALFRMLPGGPLLRTPSRLGILAVLAIDMLAALAWTRLTARRTSLARSVALAAAACVAILEAWPAGIGGVFREAPRAPAATEWLATAPRGPVLELPWLHPEDAALYVYWSTRHWQPLVNGFASFEPPGNFGLGLLGQRWPSDYSARVFREHGIRYVVIHVDRIKAGQQARVLGSARLPPDVRLAATLGTDRVYEIHAARQASPRQKEKPSETEGFPASSR